MTIRVLVRTGEYRDSVSLMLLARELSSTEGVKDAAVVMATDANKSILVESGLFTDQVEKATPNDLIVAINAFDSDTADRAVEKARQLLQKKVVSERDAESKPKTLHGALSSNPQANLAVISVPGRYAADEAWDALYKGLHVLLFSDNVSLEDEISLKRYARDHGLLLMGPGAGTTILNGVGLGFANVLTAGPVGIVSAAGTGLQEVSTLLARHGVGISQGIGVGGRDLRQEVGGIMMLEGLKALQEDQATSVLVLISKPPSKQVQQDILNQVSSSDKPAVVCFLGGDLNEIQALPNVIPAHTLYECSLLAEEAVHPGMQSVSDILEREQADLTNLAGQLKRRLTKEQKYLRGLFSGGTLCYEAQVIWKDLLDISVYSNSPLPGGQQMGDSNRSQGHTAVDLGEEEFTVGRPHPMIDNELRIHRLFQEASDPQVAVIMLDIVLGYGAHPDPALELGRAIEEARNASLKQNREILVIASATGTINDPQGLEHTISTLEHSGAIVCESNFAAALLTGLIVSG
jgi:FdrA protein